MRVNFFSFMLAAEIALCAATCPASGDIPASGKRSVSGPDFQENLRDPFSPVGYIPPVLSRRTSANPEEAKHLPPDSSFLDRAKAALKVNGIIKRGDSYVANINGSIVEAGDSVSVSASGRRVVFFIRAISMNGVEIELKK